MSYGRIDGILRYIPFHPNVIRTRVCIFFKKTSLFFIRVCGLPRAANDFSDPSHGLRVARHDTKRTHIVKNIFGRDSFCTNA